MVLIHGLAIAATAAAGCCWLVAASLAWRRLKRGVGAGGGAWWWAGLAAQTAALVLGLLDPDHRDLAYAGIGLWAGMAGLLFAGRGLAAPSRSLLVLPLGAIALLLAVAGGSTIGKPPATADGHWIALLHGGFLAGHFAALLAAGAGAGLYLFADRQLKAGRPAAIRLPPLPGLYRLLERGLVVATALLLGGIATGGAAMHVSPGFSLAHPTALLGLAELILLILVLALHLGHRLGRHALALAALACLGLGVLGAVSRVVVAHG